MFHKPSLSNLQTCELSPIPDSLNVGFQGVDDSLNSIYENNTRRSPGHTRHTSQKFSFYDNERNQLDGYYGLTDEMGMMDNHSVDFSDMSHGNAFEVPAYRSHLASGLTGDNSFLNYSNHSLLGTTREFSSRYFDTTTSLSQVQSDYPPMISEPPLFPDNEPFQYGMPTSHQYNNPPLVMEHRITHNRMNSSPLMYTVANQSSRSLSSLYPMHGSLYPDDPSPRDMNPIPPPPQPSQSSQPPSSFHSKEISPLPEVPPKKLPYPCRDFRNNRCNRGDACKFMHYPENVNTVEYIRPKPSPICRDYIRGQCQRKNCKFLHVMPEYSELNANAASFVSRTRPAPPTTTLPVGYEYPYPYYNNMPTMNNYSFSQREYPPYESVPEVSYETNSSGQVSEDVISVVSNEGSFTKKKKEEKL